MLLGRSKTDGTPKIRPTKGFIDTDYVIHHCGMHAHLKASGFDADAVQEQAIEHAQKIVKAALAGQNPPTPHAAPGIQLLAIAIASAIERAGAEKLARDFDLDLDQMTEHAASESISYC